MCLYAVELSILIQYNCFTQSMLWTSIFLLTTAFDRSQTYDYCVISILPICLRFIEFHCLQLSSEGDGARKAETEISMKMTCCFPARFFWFKICLNSTLSINEATGKKTTKISSVYFEMVNNEVNFILMINTSCIHE